MLKKIPDYMGRWTTPSGETSRFFFFSDENKMIDWNGESKIKDFAINEEEVSFVKKYVNPKGNASRHPIKFQAKTKQGRSDYRGVYEIASPSGLEKGSFAIEKYNSLGGTDFLVGQFLERALKLKYFE